MPSISKTASPLLYLVEELGDARLRCDQLVRYIADAVKLINQSPQKDHFFEVAGHLLQGIPETAFKLQKALQAVALAADHMDYEELKLDLRPEKVDELEKVLQEVRLHQVKRRSEIPNMLTPNQVAAQLRTIAKTAREEGYLPVNEIAALVGQLDNSRVAASEVPVSDVLERLAASLEAPEGKPSRVQLATLLSRIAMEADFAESVRLAGKGCMSQLSQFGSADEVREKFKAENPKLTDADLDKIVEQWEANKDVVKDKQAAGMLSPKDSLTLSLDEIKGLATKALQAAKGDRWKATLHNLYFLVDTIGTVLVNMGSMDTVKIEALKREIRELMPKADQAVSEAPAMVTASADKLEIVVSSVEDGAKAMRHALDTYKKDPGRYAPQLDNLKSAAWGISSRLRTLDRTLESMGKKASSDALDRAEALLERTAASVLWQYTDEEGKDFYLAERRRGTIRSPYTGKSFTADAKRATMGDVGKELKEDEVKVKGTLWKYVDGDDNEFYLPERLTSSLRSPITGKTFKPKAERFTLSEVGKDIREKKAASARELKELEELLADAGYDPDDAKKLQEEGMGPNELERRIKTKGLERTHGLKKTKAASDEENARRSRYEKGVPADPTENMSDEDAEAWKANTEEYGDKFKSAASGDPYWMTAKFPGKAKDGTPVKKGDKVFYYPRTKTMLVGKDAEKASREFDAAKDDEDSYRSASIDALAWKA